MKKLRPPTVPARRRDRRGVALIIVLVLVALLTGILVVFLSRSITDRQIAGSSAAETRARLLAEGAVDTLLSDLKQEIAAGSNAQAVTAGGVTTTLYPPKTPAMMVPAAVGGTGAAGTENLLKRSAYNQPFYGSAYDTGNYPPSNRAANVSSLAASLNGRLVSPARWNEHLLLEKNSALTAGDTNDSDFTPVGATATAWSGAPDWVLVTRDGSAQMAWNSGLIAQNGNNGAVTGRYAYQVFEEGGLLDVNAAGYPSTAPNNSAQAFLPSYKASVAFADLTQLPGIGDLPPARQNNLRDTLVGWRNYASAQPMAGSVFPNYTFNASTVGPYDLFASDHPKGFLSAGNSALYNDQSDRLFSSRQELFKLLLGGFASTDPGSTGKQERASLQNSLRFLTHFSRALEQPSYIPDPNRPKVVDQASSANGSDDLINPSFPAVRVTNTTARGRDDGSDLTVGDPLVKKRFALNRLAWLTYAGPITLDGSTYNPAVAPAMITTLKTTYGFTDTFLLQGTPANVYNSFGLSWVADTRTTPKGDGQSKWVYSHAGATALTSLPTGGPILRVGRPPSVTAPDSTHYVQDLNPGREPDFFELLKAAVACGSKAKTGTAVPSGTVPAGTDTSSPTFYANQDASYDLAIIQLGANIIDQFDLDDYPTRILFNDGNLLPKEVRGVENLPYLYRMRYGLVQGRAPVVVTSPPPAAANNPVIKDTGFNVLYQQPEVWNPHDQNSPAADPSVPTLVPTSFRCVAYSTDPDHIDNSSDAAATYYGSVLSSERMASNASYYTGYASPDTCDASTPVAAPFSGAYNSTTGFFTAALNGAFPLSPANAALFFNIPAGSAGAAFFREPTLLTTPNVPAGSNLSAVPPAGASGSASSMLNPGVPIGSTLPSYHPNIKPYLDATGALVSAADNRKYLGFYMTTMPANWYVPQKYVTNPAPGTPGTALAINHVSSPGSNNVLFIKHQDARSQNSPALAVTYRLQYQDPASGKWVSYDEKYASLVPGQAGSAESETLNWAGYGSQSNNPYDGSVGRDFACAHDPRTSRFGMPFASRSGSLKDVDSPLTSPDTANPSSYGWNSQPGNQIVTERPDSSSGFFDVTAATLPPANDGWSNATLTLNFGLFTQNNPLFTGDGKRWNADKAAAGATNQSYADPDGVTRRGMGAYVSGTNVTGLPMAMATNSTGVLTAQAQSRPIMLNRPFRTVGELGCVFSGTPWKNLDFFTADSGDAPLLDVFTINDTDNVNGMVAGRVNLNTRQTPVLQAIIAGAYKDEQAASATAPAWQLPGVTSAEAGSVAAALVARTRSTTPGQGPLANPAEIAGRYGTASANGTITSRYDHQKFDGFANDLTIDVNGNTVFGENTATSNVQRLREAPIRALGAAGQTRAWNLLIDLIAQTGRYPLTASKLENFVVEGEQHYWVHVAIDRLTGSVIDKQIEVVKE